MKTFELIDWHGIKSSVVIRSIQSSVIISEANSVFSEWTIEVYISNSRYAGVYETQEGCELAFKELNKLINDEL